MGTKRSRAFTLVELMVVISVISLLMAILMSVLTAARVQAYSVVCKSNLRQLLLANLGYANEHDGHFVPAASDMWNQAGCHRWHGLRKNLDEPFDPARGPLAGYLADGKVRQCPGRTRFVKDGNWNESFEKGCGGYGYNMVYVGSRLWQSGINSVEEFRSAYERTTCISEMGRPAKVLMFADCAMARDGNRLIEYSFAEPPLVVYDGQPITGSYMSPSIHFRHSQKTNAAWADGHIDSRAMADFDQENVYGVRSAELELGWFAPVDNTLFDLQ